MKNTSRRRHGFALVVALVAMVIIGALAAGAMFVSTQEYRISRNMLQQEHALAVAERGMAQALQDWTVTPAASNWGATLLRTVGDTMSRQYTMSDGSRADVRITRLSSASFLVVSDGATNLTNRQLNSRRRTGLLLKDKLPPLPGWGALNTRSTTRLTGAGTVTGNDSPPPGWGTCDEGRTNRAAVANDNAADVTSSGTCAGFSCATGTTTVTQQSALSDTLNVLKWGDMSYADMKVAANKIFDVPSGGLTLNGMMPSYSGLAPNQTCNTNDTKNWGDIDRSNLNAQCDDYFPIIYLRGAGTTTINIGSGQGILIADGNVMLNGSFTWYGPIIVRGNISTAGTANRIYGSLIAANIGCTGTPTTPCNDIKGTSDVYFSSCALTQSLRNRRVPVVASRGWADLF